MVDYPERLPIANRNADDHGPRCGAHRDFGTLTLIFPNGTSGLEVLSEDGKTWRPLEVSSGSAVLLFGWCANIRSNNRIPAALHRVEDARGQKEASMEVVPRRMSAILFVAPASDTVLQPTLLKEVGCDLFQKRIGTRGGTSREFFGSRAKLTSFE